MKTFSQYRQERDQYIRGRDSTLTSLIRRIQRLLFDSIDDLIDGLSVDADSNLTADQQNAEAPQRIRFRINSASSVTQKRLQTFVIDGLNNLVDLNRLYFKSMPDLQTDVVDNSVATRVLINYGYDRNTGMIIPGGWLDQLSDNTAIVQQVGDRIRRAIEARTPLKEFKKNFKADFTGANGLGFLESHYNTFVFDLYQQVDRTTQKDYADTLGLQYFQYAGTIKDTTRKFCQERTGRIYTREEGEKWEKLKFQGKIKVGYNPFVHAGGYNCRHSINWMSEGTAKAIAKRRGFDINSYNTMV